MGISNDIRPKKKKIERPEPPEPVEEQEKIELEEGEEEVSINRTAAAADHSPVHYSPQSDAADDFFGPFAHHQDEPDEEKPPTKNRSKKSSGSWSKIIIILLTIGLIAILIKQNLDDIYKYLGVDELIGTTKTTDSVTNPYENLNNDYTTKAVNSENPSTSTGSVAPTTEPATTQAPVVTASTLAKSSVRLSVLNGNGVSGSAATVKNALESSGYTVSNVSNAKLFSYESTVIYYKTGKTEYAEDIKKVLSNRTVELEESNSIAGTFDLVIVVGAK